MRASEFITEVFQPGKTNWEWARRSTDEASAFFNVGNREYLWQAFNHRANLKKWELQFRLLRNDNDPSDLDVWGMTGTGNSAQVLSTAVDITREFLKHYGDKVEEITFNAKKNEDSPRASLYAKMVKRLLPDWDLYTRQDKDNGTEFHLTDRRVYDKPENQINELFDNGYNLEWDDQFGPKEIHARAYDRQGKYIDINFVPVRDNVTDIEFSKMDNFDATNDQDAPRVFATVMAAIQRYLQGYQPKIVVFSGKGESRGALYQKLINRFAKQYGYQQFDTSKLSPDSQQQLGSSGSNVFVLRKKTQQVEEEVIDEMPLPADWDPQQFHEPSTSFKSRLAYALERAKKLGTGSSRVATTIEYQGRPTVLKIAKNAKGLAQNSVEASILGDGYASQLGILIPLIDYDEQNREPTWIHTEMAQKATNKQLCQIMGCDNLDQLINMAWSITGKKRYTGNYQSFVVFLRQRGVSEEQIDRMSEYANTLADLNSNFDVELGDLSRPANWGIYQGKPVLIDVGFNTNVMNQYYKR